MIKNMAIATKIKDGGSSFKWGDEAVSIYKSVYKSAHTDEEINVTPATQENLSSYSTGYYDTSSHSRYYWQNPWETQTTTSAPTTYTDTSQVEIEKMKIDLRKNREEFHFISERNINLQIEYERIKKNANKLEVENKILREKLELIEKNPEKYLRLKNIDPFDEEIWNK